MNARALILMAAAGTALAACGKIFPLGERLLPITYGPPFGSALKDNQPHHPHNPASDERHAAADSAQSRNYRSHQACHAALTAAVTAHAGGRVERISGIESVGHYQVAGVVHEYRCGDYLLSSRSWCVPVEGGHGSANGEAHKRAEPAGEACGGDTGHH